MEQEIIQNAYSDFDSCLLKRFTDAAENLWLLKTHAIFLLWLREDVNHRFLLVQNSCPYYPSNIKH